MQGYTFLVLLIASCLCPIDGRPFLFDKYNRAGGSSKPGGSATASAAAKATLNGFSTFTDTTTDTTAVAINEQLLSSTYSSSYGRNDKFVKGFTAAGWGSVTNPRSGSGTDATSNSIVTDESTGASVVATAVPGAGDSRSTFTSASTSATGGGSTIGGSRSFGLTIVTSDAKSVTKANGNSMSTGDSKSLLNIGEGAPEVTASTTAASGGGQGIAVGRSVGVALNIDGRTKTFGVSVAAGVGTGAASGSVTDEAGNVVSSSDSG